MITSFPDHCLLLPFHIVTMENQNIKIASSLSPIAFIFVGSNSIVILFLNPVNHAPTLHTDRASRYHHHLSVDLHEHLSSCY